MYGCTSAEEAAGEGEGEGEGRLGAEEDMSLFWWGEAGEAEEEVGEVGEVESGSAVEEVGSLLWEAAAVGVGVAVAEVVAAGEEGEGGRCKPQSPGVGAG